MYSIELINKKTKQVIKYDDVVDLNDGEKMFFKFQINTKQLDDGEYTLNLYDDDVLIKTDTLNVGDFNAKALQYKRGEDIYVETKIDVQLTNKFVELNDINSTVYPDEGFDGMLSVTVDATPLYNKSKAEGIEIGYADGKQDGIDEGYATGREDGVNEQKNRLTSISITENGEYSNEDGYNEITVDVQPNLQEKYVNVTDNNTTVTADEEFDGMKSVEINATPIYNNGYNVGKSDGVEQGYNNGYAVGSTEGYQNGVQVGYNDGYATGKAEGITTQRDLMTTLSVRSNGLWRRDDGYNEVNVNVESFSYLTNTVDVEGLSELGWSDDDINYYKDNSLHYEWQNKDYIVSQGNKEIVINSVADIKQNNDNPDFEFCPYFEQTSTYPTYFFTNCEYLKGIPLIDFSIAKDMQYAFNYCMRLETIPPIDTSNVTNMSNMFDSCSNLTSIPPLNTSNVTYMSNMFKGCSKLITISPIDTSKVINMNSMFFDCTSLTSIPLLDTSKVTNMNSMFNNCNNLTKIPPIDTSKVDNMNKLFYGCKKLESLPLIDTSNVTNMNSMFYNCNKLTTIPTIDTSNVTNMNSMFYSCYNLTKIPPLNTSNVTDMFNIFYSCRNITTIPPLNTSKVTNVSNMFSNCTSLQSIGLLDFSNVTNLSTFFGYGDITTLTDLGGFKNLKIDWNENFGLMRCTNLTKQSVLNVINNVYDFRANGDSTTTRTIKFHKNSLALLSDDEKAIATAKGWVLTS